tara:strand:+ start:560 stop:1354 length:795 start_codon:yes stop_codon:yes gene_type:complete
MYSHNLDPVLIEFGYLTIRWYSLAYVVGIILGWWLGKKIINRVSKGINLEFNINEFDEFITFIIISIIIGGRLGYVVFYNLEFYISSPLDILKVWQGGMSFHGALIGIVLGSFLFSKKRGISTFFLLDIVACVSPIGIFLGRIANFINGELIGKVTTVSWGVIFPLVDTLPRHPSQLYQAMLEGVVLFFILNTSILKPNYKVGTCSYLFLICYGVLRIISELFREPDAQIGYLFNLFSMGTVLSFLMIIVGLYIMYNLKKNESQ